MVDMASQSGRAQELRGLYLDMRGVERLRVETEVVGTPREHSVRVHIGSARVVLTPDQFHALHVRFHVALARLSFLEDKAESDADELGGHGPS